MINIIKIPLQGKKRASTEIELAKASIKGDCEAFTELMKIHKVSLYKIAYSYVKNEQKALDIIQDTTYKGLLNIKKLNNPEFFKTWITRILINVSIDYTKNDDKVVYLDEGIPLVENSDYITIDEKVDLYDAIDKLRDKYKMVIILKYFNDMTDEQISNNMDIPINTVKSHLRRAKEELKQILKEENLYE